jgi:hypothetical protein
LVIGIFVFASWITSHYFDFPLFPFLFVGTVCTWVGLWGLGIEYIELRNNSRKLKIAYLIGFLGLVLAFLGSYILYEYATAFIPFF